ncbi:MAG TPA: branched-chain amino acid ABC transporter permease [Syntrophales bacterium]|nr:branched-chain amino acid ABC transporter permease [Syntrophales bacterium]HOM06350.1 branched-chain amino acid ABC transporter permease [Syntrophales bacterium]HON99199.1 branched-chain amino acid ABC transporter permease [Syntrophales bacterium]HPC00307.1 branched-chain amino acid ABC transporter permease [Syntrophales bacterium]HPQ05970.1 branched-chain amino acid ABC transporter permease [Syntrophales bacterium]
MNEYLVFFLHGLAYAGLLFLISSGLTLVFGMMNVLNFAHATMYMLGAYFSYTLLQYTDNFWLSVVVCPLLLFVIGALIERVFLRRVHVYGHLHELLITFGLAYVITEGVKWIWGNYPLAMTIGGLLGETVEILGTAYPVYRIFIFLCAVLVGVIMALILYKTRLGIILRAAVNDSEMVNALGVNVPRVFTGVFAFGAALSGFAGVIAGPLLTTYPGMANDILIDAFVVIVVGGFGSLGGAVVASLLIGELQSFGVLLFPRLSVALVYLLMAAVLIIKPSGLFGEEQ